MIAGTGLPADDVPRTAIALKRRIEPAGRAFFDHIYDRAAHHGSDLRRHDALSRHLRARETRLVRRVGREVDAVDQYGRIRQAAVDDDAHELGQGGRPVPRASDRGRQRRRHRGARGPAALPASVDLEERLELEETPDAL